MATELKDLLSQLPIDNSSKPQIKQLPIDAVDKLADELTAEFNNKGYRSWYCGVIYEFGFARVSEWRRRASEGREPGRLFSKYVKDTRTFRGSKDV